VIQIKKKYVYKTNGKEKIYGMIPLHLYISIVYFNQQESIETLLSISEIVHLLTECFVEAIMREEVNINELKKAECSHFFISSIPDIAKYGTKKIIAFYEEKSIIIISEAKYFDEKAAISELKTRNFSKDELLALMLSVHQHCLILIDSVIKKCKNSTALTFVKNKDNEEENSDKDHDKDESAILNKQDKFDLSNYEKIG
jgi:hypothetical protein